MKQKNNKSIAWEKYFEFVKYYKKHPIQYVKDVCKGYNIKLYWYQKIMLMMIAKGKSKQQRELDRVLRPFKIKEE